ncbi:hypothetical protein [Sphingomonas sp. GB1N7]|uniref:hypothetical protein n=1 Tax=Parasphingomonas caseinilytica TaxID=3096158 RepID=UPI002FC744C4
MKTKTIQEWRAIPTTNPIVAVMQTIREDAEDVMLRKRDAMICFGGSGLGKNHIVDEVIARMSPGNKRVAVDAPSNYKSVLKSFHDATHSRKKPLPVVFDEARLVFGTEANMNTLKAATGDNSPKWVADYEWYDTEVDEETGAEKKVKRHGVSVDAPIFIMTNANLHDLPDKHRAHAEALFSSRAQPICIPDDRLAAWEYAGWLALDAGILNRYQTQPISLKTRVAALDWFTAHVWQLGQVSVRVLKNILREMVAGTVSGIVGDQAKSIFDAGADGGKTVAPA